MYKLILTQLLNKISGKLTEEIHWFAVYLIRLQMFSEHHHKIYYYVFFPKLRNTRNRISNFNSIKADLLLLPEQ